MPEEIRQLTFVAPPGASRLLLLRHGETTPVRDETPVAMLEGQSNDWTVRRFDDVAHLR